MNILDVIKQYTNLIVGAIILLLVLAGAWKCFQLGVEHEHVKTVAVQKQFDEHIASDKLLMEKMKNEATRINTEQDAKAEKERRDYNALVDEFNATAGVSGSQAVSGSGCLPVASVSTGNMSRDSTGASGTDKASKIATVVRRSFTVDEALSDTLQCSELIKFVITPVVKDVKK